MTRRMGAVLVEPGQRSVQRAIVTAALAMLEGLAVEAGVIREFGDR